MCLYCAVAGHGDVLIRCGQGGNGHIEEPSSLCVVFRGRKRWLTRPVASLRLFVAAPIAVGVETSTV